MGCVVCTLKHLVLSNVTSLSYCYLREGVFSKREKIVFTFLDELDYKHKKGVPQFYSPSILFIKID